MARIQDITNMCREGRVQEAYDIAKADAAAYPADVWGQRAFGWALYYTIKGDTERKDYTQLIAHLEELHSLQLLTVNDDSMILDNVQFQVAHFINNGIYTTDTEAPGKLSKLFSLLKNYTFNPSRGHSFLLQAVIKFENWHELADFIDWWNLDNLTSDDYSAFTTRDGNRLMTLAERAFIAQSKALLKTNNNNRIESFLPKLEVIVNNHPEMVYPGYFYGRLLLKMGSSLNDELKVIIPFVRKKVNDFWAWKLLSEVYASDPEIQLACLLRAVHCRTKEDFLVKVRIQLATLYLQSNQFSRAKHHVEVVAQTYISNGWRLPDLVYYWTHQPGFQTITPDDSEPVDYMAITNRLLCEGTSEAIAIITYVDANTHKASMIYAKEKRITQKLRVKVHPGAVLRINYTSDPSGRLNIIQAEKCPFPNDLDYAKVVEGTISKRDHQAFAFLNSNIGRCFISPTLVSKYNITDTQQIKAVIVYDFDKKKNTWNWVCLSIRK